VALEQLRSGKYDDETREWIVRIFETRAADPYWETVVEMFRAAPAESRDRSGLAVSSQHVRGPGTSRK
jgi:hypothetical protein